ncbi:DUF1934 domain-containing protein [Paenibacillus pinisoli]|uniref:DUF1934 domain-containing protein n=1 Tax=Paenibacillus pinisoli TaxID=1276110 RepID=A0A3A6PCF7_9BACL|nr:DUF1934 domain-containing protein [Paenibacillus pinisoli]RJX37416.1 DUF1934 domain-containing protein [Paenibacillus pinisoli]
MRDSGKAIIILESKADGEKATHRYKGEWFRKEKSLFIRYAEDEATRALIRYTPGELLLKRSGAVQSDQLFVSGQSRIGQYRSAVTVFELETRTKSLALQAKAREDQAGAVLPTAPPFTLEWRYDLYVSEQLSGRFHIRLHIQEDHE